VKNVFICKQAMADFAVVKQATIKRKRWQSDFDAAAEESRAGGGGRYEIKMSINPMQKAHAAPRCHAKSRRTGKPCRAPAVRGWKVCRMHGARGGAPEGKRNGNYRHGERSKETMALWKLIKSLR
jgi:hypothetical protein